MTENFKDKVCSMKYDLNGLQPPELEIIAKMEIDTRFFGSRPESNEILDPIRIPVVVHVVYNTEDQNIPDTQINSQIESLNKDFRGLNSDRINVPSAFSSVVADANIEFALAVRDPCGNKTNGITRTPTAETHFIEPINDPFGRRSNQPIKHSDRGGRDPWPTNKYLNIWVCNLCYDNNGSLEHSSGYSQFPGGNYDYDGVVINYDAFGTIGHRIPGRTLGRTATHEIGHWLNLKHIWGDTNRCPESDWTFDDDGVEDTPPQKSYNTGCPTFPSTAQSCLRTGPNGTMFMNYMDYTDDQIMCMFTIGQARRMKYTLNSERRYILTSLGLVPPRSP